MTEQQIDARMEAYQQAITSLELYWTDDPVEREQGRKLAEQLRKQADRWYRRLLRVRGMT